MQPDIPVELQSTFHCSLAFFFFAHNHACFSLQDPRGYSGNRGPGHARSYSYGDAGEWVTNSNHRLVDQYLASIICAHQSQKCAHSLVCCATVCVCVLYSNVTSSKAVVSSSNTQWAKKFQAWTKPLANMNIYLGRKISFKYSTVPLYMNPKEFSFNLNIGEACMCNK